jgi:hypothetical protein
MDNGRNQNRGAKNKNTKYNLFLASANFGVRDGSDAFLCWKTNADIMATASSGSSSSN